MPFYTSPKNTGEKTGAAHQPAHAGLRAALRLRNAIGPVLLGMVATMVSVGPSAITASAQDRATPVPIMPFAAESTPRAAPATPSAELVLHTASADALIDRFTRLGYSYEGVVEDDEAVPRIRVLSIPPDIADVEPVADRKHLFFRILLPLVLRENDRILAERHEIQVMEALSAGDPESLRPERRARLETLLSRYEVDEPDFETLLRRADVIPPSLALAQAAIESGWGTSRFAREGNALYGQITTAADSLISQRDVPGQPRRYAAFGDVADATISYMRNLNTHPAYRDMRALRASLMAEGEPVSGVRLAEGLLRYSERGADYVDFVQTMIRSNDLHMADAARLSHRTQLAETPDDRPMD